jgi:hypothetical protein
MSDIVVILGMMGVSVLPFLLLMVRYKLLTFRVRESIRLVLASGCDVVKNGYRAGETRGGFVILHFDENSDLIMPHERFHKTADETAVDFIQKAGL